MTEAQKQALARIEETMKEHFTAAVIVVQADYGDREDEVVCRWAGGYPAAVGLTELAKMQVWHGKIDPGEPLCGGDMG